MLVMIKKKSGSRQYNFIYGQQTMVVDPSWPIFFFPMAGLVTWCETLGGVVTLRYVTL